MSEKREDPGFRLWIDGLEESAGPGWLSGIDTSRALVVPGKSKEWGMTFETEARAREIATMLVNDTKANPGIRIALVGPDGAGVPVLSAIDEAVERAMNDLALESEECDDIVHVRLKFRGRLLTFVSFVVGGSRE